MPTPRPVDQETDRRLRKFQALGGVDLSRLEPEERSRYESLIYVGLQPHKKAIFHFVCPVCGNRATNDQAMSPACTGPSWLDEHPLEPMLEIR